MKKLPEYLNINSPELAMAIAGFLKSQGWTIEGNLLFDRVRTHKRFGESKTICLHVWQTSEPPRISNHSDESYDLIGIPVNSWLEFYNLCFDPPEPLIRIGDYEIKFSEKGVKVGCTFVDWKTIEAILAKCPK